MKQLIWSRQARGELFRIADYYAQSDPALAIDILTRIEAGPQPLLEHPYLGALTTGGARKWRARRTPFVLLYDVGVDAVEIVDVRHVRSDWPR